MNGEAPPHRPAGGELVGDRYRLEHRITDGGMGEVWRGTDTRLGRAVAVKLLHPPYRATSGSGPGSSPRPGRWRG